MFIQFLPQQNYVNTTRFGANMFVTLYLWKNEEQNIIYGLKTAVNYTNYE